MASTLKEIEKVFEQNIVAPFPWAEWINTAWHWLDAAVPYLFQAFFIGALCMVILTFFAMIAQIFD